MTMNLIGIDIGGTKCSVIIGHADEERNIQIIARDTVATKSYPDPYLMISRLQAIAEELLKQAGWDIKTVKATGISCGGPLDNIKGIVQSPPNLPGWDNIPIVKLFEKRFGIPAYVENDANACALAEWLLGAGRGTSNMIFLTFGTGMGGGLILNGRLYSGTNNLAGEVGHIRLDKTGPVGYGKAGSFEGFCSGGGIAQLAKSVIKEYLYNNKKVDFCPSEEMIEEIDTRTVALAARDGDPIALEIIKTAAEYLGQGLAILIDILNPECIVIGSIFTRNEDLFRPHIERILQQEALAPALEVCKIKPAELGESIGDYASLCVALYRDMF
ncbi:MAG TPA: ROK family protein [Bacteroidales bacterium]|nr:ROK family protein [Bacteroidales bacterium]